MEKRKFGKTGHNATVITLGGCGLGNIDKAEVEPALKMAVDYGLNTIDVAPSYGKAEINLRSFLEKHRKQFFINEKTMERSKERAWKELHLSLEKLGIENVDLYQFHAVQTFSDLDLILNENGAFQAFKEAKEIGLTKFIGITCHDDIQIVIKAIEECDEIDTVLVPVYAAAFTNINTINDFRPLLKIAEERDLGVIAIKSLVERRWGTTEQNYKTWYKPFEDPKLIEKLVHFTLSQSGVTTYSLPCDIQLWPAVLEAGKSYQKMDIEAQKELLDILITKGSKPLFPN